MISVVKLRVSGRTTARELSPTYIALEDFWAYQTFVLYGYASYWSVEYSAVMGAFCWGI